jgi:DNA modification methylase
MNTLYYGDNLDILQRYVKDESVDLIYLDPPFNSNATYNVLFTDKNGSQTASQLQAFKDTWNWPEAAPVYQELILDAGPVGAALRAFGDLLPQGGLLAYLVMMAPRLRELHRVLKPTGSIYLHCDPTASHYLKVLMDAIFEPINYQNDLVWKRTTAHNTTSRRYGAVTDNLLFYSKSSSYVFDAPRMAHDLSYTNKQYRFTEADGRHYRLHLVERNQALGIRPNLIYEYKGYTPKWGWMMERVKLEKLDRLGKLVWSSKGRPSRKIYLDEVEEQRVSNLWSDIPPIQAQAAERLGYPTQKPEALLERIIQASSTEGDVVLDPFCGCGTATVVAQKLDRQWIGIDIAQAAIRTIVKRLQDTFDDCTFEVIGEPTTAEDAQALFIQDAYQFQWWATGLVGARPAEQKKGADHGIDGRLYFADDNSGKAKLVVISVKGGGTSVAHVRDLVGVVTRENAAIGVLITMHEPTGPMRAEAAGAGVYESPLGSRHPQVQILTIEELLDGRKIDLPSQAVNQTYEKAPRERKKGKQGELGIG